MSEPPLPTVGWAVFELITPRNDPPHWTPRGGHVLPEPPEPEFMRHGGLQGAGKLVAVRYRLELETRFDVEYERDTPAVGEQAEMFGEEAAS